MNVMDAIKGRRSIRKYNPVAVSDKDLESILDAARWAPSWANTQCVRWIVVKDHDTKLKLLEALSQTNPARDAMIAAPVVLVACAETGRAGFKRGEPATDKGEWWFMFDVASAAQNLMLAAHELGLGTVHVGSMDAKKAEQILGVPAGVRVVEMIPLGHSDEQPKGPGRKELGDIVFYEKYGQK